MSLFSALKRRRKWILLAFLLVILVGFLLPQPFSNPVEGATSADWNPQSFWYYPWGKSGTHKGVDIFAREGTTVNSSTPGLVVFCGQISMGGNVVVVLGPKWRLHYYAHLQEIHTSVLSRVGRKDKIGTVGTTGNAAGKPPHLHYSIATIFPYPWKIDGSPQGWKKMFILNPQPYL
ncbi:MAG: peptidoglycan DD-metalloendopeptidase family protein [Bacteroidia bacterium]|nr:peptidoglycan DD-metalloendopeptidase family protein [Bacteroidia bacterium]